MKPKIFLSHSKKDKKFIIRIANDLRNARIDTWYDDWEIPPGESLRKEIFENGIPGCDLFFIYLSENSVNSYWCQKELDSAFIKDYEKEGGFISLFVSSDDVRNKLPLDLKALRCPTFDESNYSESLLMLTSRAWESMLKKSIQSNYEKYEKDYLHLKLENSELKLKCEQLQNSGSFNYESIISQLENKRVENPYKKISLKELFLAISNTLATGTFQKPLEIKIMHILGLEEVDYVNEIFNETGKELYDFIGPLIILNLITVQPPNTEWSEIYYLSETGRKVVLELMDNK